MLRRARHAGAGLAFVVVAASAGCASQAQTPAQLADTITHAIYANDLDTASANFDDETKKSMSRTSLGALSDRMHALGELQSLSTKASSPDQGRYEYDAHFASGTMLVQLRVDPSGKVGAYRVTPETGG